MTNTAIDAAAAAIADARLALDEATAAVTPAAVHRDAVAKRITDLESERSNILADRRTGHQDDAEHGPRLMLISVDLDELKVMLAEADAQVTPLRQAVDAARHRVAAADQALVGIREDEVLRLTMARADELGELLLQAIASIESHRPRLTTTRNIWNPSAALAHQVHKLHLSRI
jgi:chromosome segregation ATPase